MGFPVERFLAGPRIFLEPLLTNGDFRALIEGRYYRLIHGPMLGSITDSQARFWVRTFETSDIFVEVNEKDDPWDKKRFTGKSLAEHDYTAAITAEGLKPNTSYHYKVLIDGSLFFATVMFSTFCPKGGTRENFAGLWRWGRLYTLEGTHVGYLISS